MVKHLSRLTLVALLAASAQTRAATLVLDGPAVIHVGDHPSYTFEIVLDPSETLTGANVQLTVDGGRSLALFDPYLCDCQFRNGFFSASYIVDTAAAVYQVPGDPLAYQQFPVVLEGGPGIPLDANGNYDGSTPNPDYTSAHGPIVVIPFTLTALAPGELDFRALTTSYPFTSPATPPVHFSFHANPGNGTGATTFEAILPPGSDGVYARIQIVPEPAVTLLALALLPLLRRALR